MTKRKKPVARRIIALAVLFYVAWFGLTGLLQCYHYHSFLGLSKATVDRFCANAVELELPTTEAASGISIGYAITSIRPESAEKVAFVNDCVVIDCNQMRFIFACPVPLRETRPSKEPNTWNDYAPLPPLIPMKPPNISAAEMFDLQVRAAHTMPKRYYEIFLMNNRSFRDYIGLAVLKTFIICGENGIFIFENDNIKGFVSRAIASKF